jgi:hypothetical protein
VITDKRLGPRVLSRVCPGALLVGALFCVVLSGCGKSNPYVTVTGTVKYTDGEVPQGEMSSITFQPKASGPGSKGAQGTIEPDGTFELQTERPGDGARPGEYFVTLNIIVGYPNIKSVVPMMYTNPRNSPLTAEVKSDGENHFDFTIKKKTKKR